jgi:WD40 repeat protein
VDKGWEVAGFQGEGKWFRSVAFSPNGKTLASVRSDGMVQLWELSTRKPIFGFQGHDRQLHQVAFSPNRQALASGGIDRTVVIWDTDTRKEFRLLKGHECDVGTVAFSPDGKFWPPPIWGRWLPTQGLHPRP